MLPDGPALYVDIIELVRSSQGQLTFNDGSMALSGPHRGIPYIASFDRDFDTVAWLQRLAKPEGLAR